MAKATKAKVEKDFKEISGVCKELLDRYDQAKFQEAERDCCVCLNLMIDAVLLPCQHRVCS